MSNSKQGGAILDDEKHYDVDPFDIFTLPPKEIHQKAGKTITIRSSIPVTDAGAFYSHIFPLLINLQLFFQDHTSLNSNRKMMNIQ